MRTLLPHPGDDPDVHEHYGRDWLAAGGLRMNFVASLDGAVSAAGLSAGLQTPGDNRVFAALRDLADVTLVGSGTALAEGYTRPVASGRHLEARRRFGLADAMPLGILSRSGRGLEPDSDLFTKGDAPRALVFTTAAADVAGLAEVADVVVAGERELDWAAVRRALAERGHTRLLCEGGPTIFAQAAAAGAVDELCLSLSPLLSGPGPGRITAGAEWADSPRPLTLHSVLEEDGALFLRYQVS